MSVPSEVSSVIERVASVLGLTQYNVKMKGGNKKGEGYLGEILFLELINPSDNLTHDLVIKKAFTDSKIRDTAPVRFAFINEVYFYDTVVPALQKFEVQIGLNKFDKLPKCYLTSLETPMEYIVMENLKGSGFQLFDKKQIATFEHMEFIFKVYGEYHASSFIMREQNPKLFETLNSGLDNIYHRFMDVVLFTEALQQMFNMLGDKLIPGTDDDVKKAFKRYENDVVSIFKEKIDYTGKYAVICHGDAWSNNMMFKFDSNGNFSDIKLLDFQLAHKGSIVQDLTYCLYSSASKETFDRLDELLSAYHESFSVIVKKCGGNPDELLPLKELKKEWIEYCAYGFIMAFMVIRLKTKKDDDVVDLTDLGNMSNEKEMMHHFINGPEDDDYNRRIRNLLLHLYEIKAL